MIVSHRKTDEDQFPYSQTTFIMQAALRGLFGGKAAKSSGSSGGNNATSDESADPTDVAPPLLTSVFGRPPSYTYAPVFRPQQVPPPGQPPQDNHTQAPGPQQLSPTGQPRQPVQQPLDSIPENAPVYPVANTFQSNTYKWHMNNQTFKTQYADSVSTFVPDAQPRKPHVDDEERASSSKASVGDAVRPPIERALKMQSRDVTGWQEAMKEQKRQRQDDDKIFVSMAVPLDERPPAPPRPSPIRPTSPMQAVMTDKNLGKPTCSLNLICYRPGSQGCVLRQVRVIDKQRFQHDVDYDEAVKQDPGIIESDKDFFDAIQTEYTAHMCGFWRRYFSLKTLRHIRLLSVRLLSSRLYLITSPLLDCT